MNTLPDGLTSRAVSRARRALARSHPTTRRITPRVARGQGGNFVLTFNVEATLADGGTLRQTIRATINAEGDLLRVMGSK
jgi:hypothetical protein